MGRRVRRGRRAARGSGQRGADRSRRRRPNPGGGRHRRPRSASREARGARGALGGRGSDEVEAGAGRLPRRRRGRLPVRLPADSHARGGRRRHAHHDGGVVQASARAPDARAPAGRTERPALGNARVGSLGESRAGGGAAAPAVPRLVRRRRRARGPAGDVPAGLQGAHLPAARADRLGDAGSHAGAAPAVGRGARPPVPTRDQLQPSTGPKRSDGWDAQGARGGDGGADGPVHQFRGAAREARAARSELQGG